MKVLLLIPLMFAWVSWSPVRSVSDPKKDCATWCDNIEAINQKHQKSPGKLREKDLADKLSFKAKKALEALLALEDPAVAVPLLQQAGEAALDLALVESFQAICARMEDLQPDSSDALGSAYATDRYLLRGLGGLDEDYLRHFGAVLDAILDTYREVFGFTEWSKVPGKLLRVRIHVVERIMRPPHFAPEFPFHSEIDFPVVDTDRLRSPTADGKFLLYGLCHELGHVIAMWGRPDFEEDHHAWAHYTGCVIVERLSKRPDWEENPEFKDLGDKKWRSLDSLREEVKTTAPGFDSKDAVQAFLLKAHDELGPAALGRAINFHDEKDKRRRVNHVRFYTFEELRSGLEETVDKHLRKPMEGWWPRG
ncbi:MAG: hypothetical protein R3F33_02685 [Planctomycetota bacterium]